MPTETNFAPNLGEIFEAHNGPVEVFDFNGVPSGAAPEGAFGIDTSNGDFYQVVNGSWVFKFSTGGGVGAVQTPWAQDIQGAGFDLLNVRDITATRNITAEGRLGAFDTTRVGDTDNEWYWKAEDAGMSLYGTGSGGTFKYMSISDPNEGMVLHGSYSFHASGFDGKQLNLVPNANEGVVTISGYSLTVANAQSMIDLAGTWNTSGAPTAIKLNVLDTASDAASLLMDLQTGSASKFKVGRLGSVTMTGLQTITQATVNTGILASTGYSLTGSNATSMLDLAGTWNTTGAPTAFKLNIVNTASNAASLLADFQVGGVSKFKVDNLGFVTASIYDTTSVRVNSGGIQISSTWSLGFTDGGITGNKDTTIFRDAANTLALRNSTNAQSLRIYNSFTTINTSGEWLKIDWKITANQCRIGTVRGSSSGTARVLSLDYGALESSPTAAITIPITSGNIVFGGGVQLSNTAVTGLTPGALAATTDASIVLHDSSGQAYRVPCII